jgi:hypothetical protein
MLFFVRRGADYDGCCVGGTAMHYRAYILNNGRIRRVINLDCADDDAAKQMAARLLDSRVVEVWCDDRKVTTLRSHVNEYRLCLYDKDGQLVGPAMIIAADTDDAAIAEADKRVGSNIGAELWARGHIIKEFAPKH